MVNKKNIIIYYKMNYSRQNMPCIVYSVLAVVIVVIYIVLTSKTAVHARDAIAREKTQHSGVFMHMYDVAVVYGIIVLLLNLLLVGAVLYLLCKGGHHKLSYSIITLVLVLWITYIVVVLQSYSSLDADVVNAATRQ